MSFFFTRLTDVSCPHPSMEDNQLRDFGALPRYMNCTLVDGHPIIRNYMTRYQPIAASHSHNPDKYIRDLSSRYVGINVEKEYLRYHPRSFLVADIVESNLADGIRLPAHPGIAAAEIADLARFRAVPEEQRLFMLKYFRYDMLSNRQNRSGISVPRHLERARRVTGILFLSDSLLMHVEMLKLSNALLERFSTTQGVEDMIAIINRCSYEELDIRHCVLAWGHDLIVYLKNDAVDAAGRTICVLLHLHEAFERKKLFFEQEGYRKRNAPQFWLITIPEVGYFAQQFKVFNKTVRFFTAFREDFHLLDWALLVKSDCSANTLQNLFTKEAVERRFRQLFELCRHELDLTFCQFQEEKSQERLKSWRNKDYDCI
ncbi:hypothetical protein KIN20_019844 [Parelaphostrongylus tenuis]|uniref:Uncharacterized protein n=1 Tax=Parelaphostrongylus tenuis TaxID=148309 RepID=A0AAD5N5W6_PARTN|nr:hypothetical protein KIN20_019844 [Parelaphostrongylus tenuis]